MSLLGLNPVPREPVTSEWEDIHRSLGNLPPLEALPSAAAASSEVPSPAGDAAREEDEELVRLRAQRLDELKASGTSGVPRFGVVARLSRADYTREVNEAGEGVAVVVLLAKAHGHYLSSYTLVLLEQLARKYGDVKFLQMESTECIANYPDRNLPTLLVYRDDDLLGQCVGPAVFGGSSFGIDDVEWELAQTGIIETTLQSNPHRPREKPR